ncbi:hypothetical protein AB6A40_001658 [Gnathostoma spinigerum]|uniref:C2H2-type domain-containing protein n=1 Tax=Gnathostoma spinigerum TaxID=75299 RepID=A0ABD6E9X7_9BILA
MVSSPDENSPECPVADHESVLRLGLDTAATGISFERLKSSQKSTVESPLASETSNKVIVTEKAAEHEDNYPLYKRLDISSSSSTVTSENGADTVEMLRSSGKRVLVTEEEDCRVPRTSNQGKSRDEINESCLKENGGSCGNGVANCTTKLKRENSVECLDNDEVDNEPPLKKKKDEQKSPIPDDPEIEITSVVKPPEKRSELTSSEALLDKLDEYVKHAIESGISVERKILDALLGAINIQVQREPLSVRKLILDKQLVLPNTISFPPSQVVDLLIEHDPDAPLAKVITKMFGDERPKLTEAEKRDRHLLKLTHPAPHMTKLLMDIGQDLVQESTYSDIVHAKNLPETPKNMETYKQVAQQLKPVWEALRKKNESYKLKQHGCQLCAFKTESRLVLAHHRQTPHFDGRKYTCALCPEYFTNEHMIAQHYL